MARNPVSRSPMPPSRAEAMAVRRGNRSSALEDRIETPAPSTMGVMRSPMPPSRDEAMAVRRGNAAARREDPVGYAKGGMVGMKPVRCF